MNWQDRLYNDLAEGSGGVKSLQRRGAAQSRAGDKAGAATTKTALQYRVASRSDARGDAMSRNSAARASASTDTNPRLPQKPPAFRKPDDPKRPLDYGDEKGPTRGKERSKTARRALQRGAGGGDKLTGGEDRSHRSMPDDIKHRRTMAMGEPKTAQAVEWDAESDKRMRKDRAAKRRMSNPDNRRTGSFLSLSQRQDSETHMNWQDRIYESLTEVSLKMAAQAAGKARHTRPQQVPPRAPNDPEGRSYATQRDTTLPPDQKLAAASVQRTDAQVKRIKDKFAQRAIEKHGEAGEKKVYTKPGEVPAELGGGRYERSLKGTVPKRTVYSGFRRETRAQTVDRKFEKIAKKSRRTADMDAFIKKGL